MLDDVCANRYQNAMDDEITPQAIEQRALDARVSLTAVLKRAGVSRGTFYRARRGDGEMLPLTKMRLLDAIDYLSAERTSS